MSIETTTYIRKPLYVEAVQVTTENFSELALWCQGEIIEPPAPGGKQHERHILIRVTNPMNPRQSQARVGDWILTSDRGYKIYTPKAFVKSFDMADEPSEAVQGARGLFASTAADAADVVATAHQEAKEGWITTEEADAVIVASPVAPVKPPVGSGPMPKQPEPTDVEVKHVPAVPENLKSPDAFEEDDARLSTPTPEQVASDLEAARIRNQIVEAQNIVYPEGYVPPTEPLTGDALREPTEEELLDQDRGTP